VFDVGFSELIVIAIVALVVIGPERLPKVARTAGLLLGRLQRYVNDVKADINREMQLDELKTLRSELQESARNFERRVSAEISSVEQMARQTAESVAEAASSPSSSSSADASATAKAEASTSAIVDGPLAASADTYLPQPSADVVAAPAGVDQAASPVAKA
jgi:sec-independent protein translocase protein TatB